MIRDHRACGFCAEFTASTAPTSECRQGNPGNAGSTVHATQRPCVLFKRAADLVARERFMAKHQQRDAA